MAAENLVNKCVALRLELFQDYGNCVMDVYIYIYFRTTYKFIYSATQLATDKIIRTNSNAF